MDDSIATASFDDPTFQITTINLVPPQILRLKQPPNILMNSPNPYTRAQTENPMAFAPESTASSILAFSPTLPLLAAGTLPAPGLVSSLTIMRASTALSDSQLFTALDCFPSPAPFRSICWSAASDSTSPAGFVAGGLDDGHVGLWPPKIVGYDLSGSGEHPMMLENYCLGDTRAPSAPTPPQNPISPDHDLLSEYDIFNLAEEMSQREGRSVVYGREAWTPLCLSRERDNLVRMKIPALKDEEAVAFFRHKQNAPVLGVSFNLVEPHILASVAGKGLVIWDLSCTQSDSVRTWEDSTASPERVTCVSWSTSRDMLACAYSEGTIKLFDIRTQSPAINRATPSNRACSCIQFSPQREHELVVSYGDSSDNHSVWLWDTRTWTSLWRSCDHSEGINSLSWNKSEDMLLVGTNNSKIKILSTKDKKIISEITTATPCLNLDWSNKEKGLFAASFDKKISVYALQ